MYTCRSRIWFFLVSVVKYIMRTFWRNDMQNYNWLWKLLLFVEWGFGSSKSQSTEELKKSRYVVGSGHPYYNTNVIFYNVLLIRLNQKSHLQFSLVKVNYMYTFIGKYQTKGIFLFNTYTIRAELFDCWLLLVFFFENREYVIV